MMLFLIFYVFNNGVFFFCGIGERTISVLPSRERWEMPVLLHP
ncbi:MAG: hypothetical protein JWR72_2739 [Flavisolibacter sp.]|nr:hypothetical protein [Flavisolibacter sp.]